jgi:hypothetical protein
VKRVEFCSPTFAEFNETSPAERVTPMITRRPSFSDKIYEDTAEIEADMQSLMNSNVHNMNKAGSTPFAKRSLIRMNSVDDSDMSVDSTAVPFSAVETTMTLETDMLSLLKDAPQDLEPTLPDSNLDEENTMELETDINVLLNIPITNNHEPMLVGRRSLVFDDEPTSELESDMNALFSDLASNTNQEHKSPIESRRFSIAPSRRLSISMDGSFEHLESDDVAVMKPNNRINAGVDHDNVVFDLKVGEFIDLPSLLSLYTTNTNDFLSRVEQVMRENGTSDTMEAFTNQVMQMIVSQTSPNIDLNSVLEVNEGDVDLCSQLQQHIRSLDKAVLRGEIQKLAVSINDLDTYEWLMWLVSATEQLSRPMDEKRDELVGEIERLDQLCIDTEQCLASVKNKSIRNARKKSMDQRMVRKMVSKVYNSHANATNFFVILTRLKLVLWKAR